MNNEGCPIDWEGFKERMARLRESSIHEISLSNNENRGLGLASLSAENQNPSFETSLMSNVAGVNKSHSQANNISDLDPAPNMSDVQNPNDELVLPSHNDTARISDMNPCDARVCISPAVVEGVSNHVGAQVSQVAAFPSLNDAYRNGGLKSPTSVVVPLIGSVLMQPSLNTAPIVCNNQEGNGLDSLRSESSNVKANFRYMEVPTSNDEGIKFCMPVQVVNEVQTRFENTLYGYFIGKRLAYPVVEYFVKQNWGKFGLTRIMLNAKGFFFFKFSSHKGLEDVLENGPWMIRKVPIVLKEWSIDTRLEKEELTSLPVWVKIHNVPIQVFSEDGLSIIASHVGKPVMLDAYTTNMCRESWGRSSYARCLIEVSARDEPLETLTFGVPLSNGSGYSNETVTIEYEWTPLRCSQCYTFGHDNTCCPKIVTACPMATQVADLSKVNEQKEEGFQNVKRKKKRGKKTNGSVNGGFQVGSKPLYVPKVNLPASSTSKYNKNAPSIPKAGTSASSTKSGPALVAVTPINPTKRTNNPDSNSEFPATFKAGFMNNISRNEGGVGTSNSFEILNQSDSEVEEVENVYDEAAYLYHDKRDKAK